MKHSKRGLRDGIRDFVLYCTVAWAFIGVDWFGLEKVSRARTQDVANQVLASCYDEATSGGRPCWLRGRPAAKREAKPVTVVMVSERTLANESVLNAMVELRATAAGTKALAWPLPYEFHASVVKALAGVGPPRGILVDILFSDPRPGAHVETLMDGFRAAKGVDIALACGATCGCEGLRDDLYKAVQAARGGAPGTRLKVYPSPVPKLTTGFDGVTRRYPLVLPLRYRDVEDESEAPLAEGDGPCATAALQMLAAQEHDVDLADFQAPLELMWGVRVPQPETHPLDPAVACEPALGPVAAFRRVLRGDDVRYTCPYTTTIPAEDLFMDPPPDDLRAKLKNAFVVYGTDLTGVSDRTSTSVYHRLPGPYVHAAALDNLLRWKTRYARREVVTSAAWLPTAEADAFGSQRPSGLLLHVSWADTFLVLVAAFLWASVRWAATYFRPNRGERFRTALVKTVGLNLVFIVLPLAALLILGAALFQVFAFAPVNLAGQLFAFANAELFAGILTMFSERRHPKGEQ